MNKNYNDLLAFVSVAREGSFTKAAALLGVSQSALSHTVRGLETKLDVRLLHRTTRSVAATEAGERLLMSIGPKFDEIDYELELLNEFKLAPAGTVRITAAEHAVISILNPKLTEVVKQYPDINIEINIDYSLTDIVMQRFDAGVRIGESLDKDMIAVPISQALRMAVVGSKEYFKRYSIPQTPRDLIAHNCINLRLPTYGGLYQWEFEKDGKSLNVGVTGQFTFNSSTLRLQATLNGVGLSYLPEDMVQEQLKTGELIRVLDDWCQPFDGYYLYYPNRQLTSPAFKIIVDSLRVDKQLKNK